MEFSSCPICQLTVPSSEIERHANKHFSDEDYSTDFKIAQQIALAPSSPPRFAEDTLQLVCGYLDHSQSSSSGYLTRGRNLDEKCANLVHSQKKESFYKVEGGLMLLLKSCLELDRENSVSILSGHVDHIQSSDSEDAGWGCGWRNIQMLCSHLLSQRQEASNVLFGGSGFIPDIASLQRWLELAWEMGFDTPGSDDFDKKIYGKCDWIGTTECATLFRSFGLRAGIVDFGDKDLGLDSSVRQLTFSNGGKNKSVDKRKIVQVCGPMDIFLSEGKLDLSLSVNSKNGSSNQFNVSSHKVIEWVWNYFSGNKVNKPGNPNVILSEKAPLYFQHHGHSRTIVGIQATRQRTGMQRYNLLIFDPAEKTRALEKSLRANIGWQKLIKRGAHTLKKLQYQLCFLDYGVAHGEELERLKVLHSSRHNL